jgi:hypothetical protein
MKLSKKLCQMALAFALPLAVFAAESPSESTESEGSAIIGAGVNIQQFNDESSIAPTLIFGLSDWSHLGNNGDTGLGFYHFDTYGNINPYSYNLDQKEGKVGVSGSLAGRFGMDFIPGGNTKNDTSCGLGLLKLLLMSKFKVGVSSGYQLNVVSGLYSQGFGKVDVAVAPGLIIADKDGVFTIAPLIGMNGNTWQFAGNGQTLMLNASVGYEILYLIRSGETATMMKLRQAYDFSNLYSSEGKSIRTKSTDIDVTQNLSSAVQLLIQMRVVEPVKADRESSRSIYNSAHILLGLGYSF